MELLTALLLLFSIGLFPAGDCPGVGAGGFNWPAPSDGFCPGGAPGGPAAPGGGATELAPIILKYATATVIVQINFFCIQIFNILILLLLYSFILLIDPSPFY